MCITNMNNFERKFSYLLFGSIFPLSLGLLSVTLWFIFDKSESRPILYLTIGLLLGLLIDLKYLTGWINRRFELPIRIIVIIYLVYNTFVYGFFMGLPLFNVLLGILAGYYAGNRICYNKINSAKHSELITKVSIFSGSIMALVCVPSGILALMDFGAHGMIKDILGLNFDITNLMMWGIVIIGGLILVILNILLTRTTIIKTIKFNTKKIK